jgi:hypothetical protein
METYCNSLIPVEDYKPEIMSETVSDHMRDGLETQEINPEASFDQVIVQEVRQLSADLVRHEAEASGVRDLKAPDELRERLWSEGLELHTRKLKLLQKLEELDYFKHDGLLEEMRSIDEEAFNQVVWRWQRTEATHRHSESKVYVEYMHQIVENDDSVHRFLWTMHPFLAEMSRQLGELEGASPSVSTAEVDELIAWNKKCEARLQHAVWELQPGLSHLWNWYGRAVARADASDTDIAALAEIIERLRLAQIPEPVKRMPDGQTPIRSW